jgi:SAM-dependent methyltransferase
MTEQASASPFAGAAPYYKHRAPYAAEALGFVRDTFALDRASRVLDLGCGPGKLAIPLSSMVGEVVAVDPEEAMLAEGRKAAAEAGRGNLRWLCARAEEISPALGGFHAATMGQSFHWMERDLVLRRLAPLVHDGGGLALIAPSPGRQQESWESRAGEIAARYLGVRTRHPRANPHEPENEPALRRSTHFSRLHACTFDLEIVRDIPSIIGCIYSLSHSARPLFGDRAAAFERELTDALLRDNPSGRFVERVDTEVVIATRAR